MDARFVMIHQVQFSSFFLFINHIPVKAAPDVKLSAIGTVLFVKRLRRKYKTVQQLIKKTNVFIRSFFVEAVICSVVLPSDLRDHMIHPIMLITV